MVVDEDGELLERGFASSQRETIRAFRYEVWFRAVRWLFFLAATKVDRWLSDQFLFCAENWVGVTTTRFSKVFQSWCLVGRRVGAWICGKRRCSEAKTFSACILLHLIYCNVSTRYILPNTGLSVSHSLPHYPIEISALCDALPIPAVRHGFMSLPVR